MKVLHISNLSVRSFVSSLTLIVIFLQAVMVVRNEQYESSLETYPFYLTKLCPQVMIFGEICNFAGQLHTVHSFNQVSICKSPAYAFVESLVVVCLPPLSISRSSQTFWYQTPLGALSVVICAVLSSFFLNEKLTFFGWLGCGLCIVSVSPLSF